MNLLEFFRVLKNEDIARRYFIMNSFDGALTILGVIIAMFLAGVRTPYLVIVSCLGVAVSLLVSGIWSAYAAEKAERSKALKELERHLMKELDETRIGRKFFRLSILVALVNGLSPMIVSLILLSPFILSQLNILSISYAFLSSFLLVLLILFSIGVVVGKIAEESVIKNGLKMLSAGAVVGIIISLLEILKVI